MLCGFLYYYLLSITFKIILNLFTTTTTQHFMYSWFLKFLGEKAFRFLCFWHSLRATEIYIQMPWLEVWNEAWNNRLAIFFKNITVSSLKYNVLMREGGFDSNILLIPRDKKGDLKNTLRLEKKFFYHLQMQLQLIRIWKYLHLAKKKSPAWHVTKC